MSAHSPIGHSHCCFFHFQTILWPRKKDDLAAYLRPSLLPPSCLLFFLLKACMAPIVIIWRPASTSASLWLCFFCFSPIEKNQTQKLAHPRAWQNRADTWNRRGLWTLNLWPSLALGAKNFIQVMHAAWLSTHLVMHAIQCDWPADQCRLSLTTN